MQDEEQNASIPSRIAATSTDRDADADNDIMIALGADAPEPLYSLLSGARRVCYEPKDILYHVDKTVDTVYFITQGMPKLIVHLPNGSERIVRLHRPGSVLGLSGLRDQTNDHTAVAVTPVVALQLPLRTIEDLRTKDPASYASLTERWLDYLQTADTWIAQFSTGSIRSRVARMLAFLTEFEPDAADGQVQLLTCEEMGSILGVTGESVSRTLAEFKRQQILVQQSKSNEVYDVDVDRLNNISIE